MNQPAVDPRVQREEYYQRIAAKHLTPLWEVLASLVPEKPASPCVATIWRYAELRPWLMESGQLISAHEAVRRVLILENPGLPGSSAITQSLYAGLQLILPGEIAPSHRHTQSALRLIVEGSGAYTAVEGERVIMHPGDFIITPSWTWHDHGNDAERAGGLAGRPGHSDRALARLRLRARTTRRRRSRCRVPEGDSLARYGNNLLPVDYEPASRTSPVFAYPYARTRESLEHLRRAGAPHAAHGYKMQFVNPATGGYAMPTMATFVQLLPAGFAGGGYRSTDGTVFHVIEGEGARGRRRAAHRLRRPRHLRGAGLAAVPVRGPRRRGAVQLLRSAGAARARSVARRAAAGVTPIPLSPVLPNHADAAWFACLGLPLSACGPARCACLSGRRSTTRRTRRSPRLPDWKRAEAITRDPDWDRTWWAREEDERERLMRVARDRLGRDALLERLTAATEMASQAIHGAAAIAAERDGVADAALVRAASGAATMALHGAALARLAGQGPEHLFVRKYALFESGRWPLGVVGGLFYLF